MEYSIKHLFHIDAPLAKVFEAISTIDGLANWWTVQTEGDASLGGTVQFHFGEMLGPEVKVIENVTNDKIMWESVGGFEGWIGHTFEFLLDENDGKTRVRFSHGGWPVNDDFYATCCFSWGRYMESLRQYCQTGVGEAYGSEGYRQ